MALVLSDKIKFPRYFLQYSNIVGNFGIEQSAINKNIFPHFKHLNITY